MAVDMRTAEMQIVGADGSVMAYLDALQGTWTAEQYLKLSDYSHALIEFTDGNIEVAPMPSEKHQTIIEFLFFILRELMRQSGGVVKFAPLRLKIRPDRFREPDIMLLLDAKDARRNNAFWLGADFVVEVVSPDNPERDTVEKRRDYAEAGIPEYWIVHPDDETITVLRLEGDQYIEHGAFRRGDSATSILLPEFTVDVNAVFDAQ